MFFMIKKTNANFKFRTLLIWVILVFLFLLSNASFSQPNHQDIPTQRLLLKLTSSFLNVAKQNQIDIDSGLALAADRGRMNRMIVIGEKFQNIVPDPGNKWVATEDINSAKKLVSESYGLKRIELLNLIGFFYAFKPASRTHDLDSALRYLSIAKQEAEKGRDIRSQSLSLCCIGKCYLERGDLVIADSVFTLVIDRSSKSGDKEIEAMARDYWGTYNPFRPNTIADRIDQLERAKLLYEQLNDRVNQVNTLMNIGYLSFAAGKMERSKESFVQALALEKSMGFPFTHYTAYMNAVVIDINGDHEAQLRFSMNAIKTAENTRDSIALAYMYSYIATIDLIYRENMEEGLEWAWKSLAEFKRLGGGPDMYVLAQNMAQGFLRLGRNREAIELTLDLLRKYPPQSPIDRQNAYFTLGIAYDHTDPVLQEKYYLAAGALQKETEKVRGNLGAFHTYFIIGEFYLKRHEYQKSREYLNKAITYPIENQISEALAEIQIDLSTIDSASSQFKDAYYHVKKAYAIENERWPKLSSKQVDELRVRYETGKKADSINLLHQQASLQNVQIKQDKFTRKVFLGVSALLLLFLGLLYNRYRLKQKSNKQLESQQKEISQKNATLQHLVEEKEWLLKEVHHRVKNNLHTVICLLESQAEYLKDDALKAIENSQHRIYAMSLIHQKLYQSDDEKTIDMATYLPEFMRYLDDSFGDNRRIYFELDIEPLQLGISQAIPIALIVNEAVTNSFKYAFPGKKEGHVEISMHRMKNKITLIIADDGIGIDTSIVNDPSGSLGLKLIKGLSEDINGTISFENDAGTKITIVFNVDPLHDTNNILNIINEKQVYA